MNTRMNGRMHRGVKGTLLLVVMALVLLPGVAFARNSDKALMLTVFGTSTEASVTFDELLPLVKERFPDRDVVIPFTSKTIRDKLNAGIKAPEDKILSPEEMLAKLKADGYTDIAVVSTILFPGVEHDKLSAAVDAFAKANQGTKISYVPPLLSRDDALEPVVGILGKFMIKNGPNVVVTHGTHEGHPVEKVYRSLAAQVAKRYPNARVGSVEGVPDIDEVMEWVGTSKDKDVRFVVFMFVAGDHAENDIAGDEEDSFFTRAKELGKNPSVPMVDGPSGKRIASLGLDPDYRRMLLDYYSAQVR